MLFCVFRLYAPLSSWGDIAVGMERRSYYQPSKSAVIGLVSAALGIERSEENKLIDLFNSLGLGIKLVNSGSSSIDYHTSQNPKRNKNYSFRTRRDELYTEPKAVNTILSRREYRNDSLSIIALWEKDADEAVYTLEEVQKALFFPKFHLYLGRKSCPPALPLEPQLIEAVTLAAAFNKAEFGPVIFPFSETEHDVMKAKKIEKNIFNKHKPLYFWDECRNSGFTKWTKRTEKYDRPINRSRWQFGLRYEYSAMENQEE